MIIVEKWFFIIIGVFIIVFLYFNFNVNIKGKINFKIDKYIIKFEFYGWV